jgi:hypothetical protein
MSGCINLDKLRDNQQALLLAETAALLHDMGKCADEQIINQSSVKPVGYTYNYRTAQSHLLPSPLPDVILFGETISIGYLIEKGMPKAINDINNPWILRVLGRCHSVAHVEKELKNEDTTTKQPKEKTQLSNAYGLEGDVVCGLTKLLHSLPFAELNNRNLFFSKVRQVFRVALGDTRLPVNEVTLADWSDAVAALYKSALSGGLLGIKPEPDDLHWRILRVNFDVLGLYVKAITIADLLGYQRIVDDAYERVKQLLEVEYPLGNEVYRDTTGIYFTFPDFSLPEELQDKILCCVIKEEKDQELAPRIEVTEGDGTTAVEQLKGILAKARSEARRALGQPYDPQNYSSHWQELWAGQWADQKWEVCPVCRLRPMAEGREACNTCLERRRSRIEDWQKNLGHTIWMDEIADRNGRAALLVGKFGLEDWLSGDLVQTMLVKAVANAPEKCIPKNPSPARLRRVWETCFHFWVETVVQGILEKLTYGRDTGHDDQRCTRRLIIPDKKNGWKENVAYDGTVEGKQVSLFWLAGPKHFITIINLQLAGELREGQKITVDDPDHPRKKTTFIVQGIQQPDEGLATYKPFQPLLISPDQFLALVPAAEALKIAEQVRDAYTLQFGKVQNRLPLLLGSVFFQRKMPLLAVIEAGRRILDGWNPEDEAWIVERKNFTEDVQTLKLQLTRNGQIIDYDIPIKMGDGTTDDIWYPYFRLVHDAANSRKFSFEKVKRVEAGKGNGDNGVKERDKKEKQLWVRAADLRGGDAVYVRPSRFAYTFLEQTAQRFRFDPQKTLLFLDELPRLMKMWVELKETPDMTDTKLRGIQSLFEAKQRLWGPDDTQAVEHEEKREPFRRLVETTFRRERISGIKIEEVLNGSFQRCLEIYLYILKQRNKKEAQNE